MTMLAKSGAGWHPARRLATAALRLRTKAGTLALVAGLLTLLPLCAETNLERGKRIIDECYVLAQETLKRKRHRLEALAEALLKQESLDEKAILGLKGVVHAEHHRNHIET